MGATYTEWHVQLINDRTKKPIDDDSGKIYVWTAGAPTTVTLYSDDRGTSLSNGMTMTDGARQFYTDSSVTSLDLLVITSDGYGKFVRSFVPSDHHICIDKESRRCTIFVPFGAATTETSMVVTLPANLLIDPSGTCIKVTTIDATEDVTIGILSSESGGDADGFIKNASVATAGYVEVDASYTGSANGLGALLVSNSELASGYVTNGTATTLSYTASAGSDTAAGYFVLSYDVLI